jgi:hypothetical protein
VKQAAAALTQSSNSFPNCCENEESSYEDGQTIWAESGRVDENAFASQTDGA